MKEIENQIFCRQLKTFFKTINYNMIQLTKKRKKQKIRQKSQN